MEAVVKCMNCGNEMGAPAKADRPYDALPGAILSGVEVRTCSVCGEEEVAIPRLTELNRVLARFVARHNADRRESAVARQGGDGTWEASAAP
jgi:hypothetical protein